MKLSKSLEDYLEAVHILYATGGSAHVKDISTALDVKMPSVARAIAELKRLRLVKQEPYGGVELTAKGAREAAKVFERHILLKAFLERLGVSEKTANADACLMEHILSAETIRKIETFMKPQRKQKRKSK